jgi:hypothetical protein
MEYMSGADEFPGFPRMVELHAKATSTKRQHATQPSRRRNLDGHQLIANNLKFLKIAVQETGWHGQIATRIVVVGKSSATDSSQQTNTGACRVSR